MSLIYHIALSKDWQQAQETGIYTIGSLGRSFEEDGFIHMAYAPQVNVIADLIYSDTKDLVLLTVDVSKLTAKVKDEQADFPKEMFPHLYGPLNIDAVIKAEAYEQLPNNTFPSIDNTI